MSLYTATLKTSIAILEARLEGMGTLEQKRIARIASLETQVDVLDDRLTSEELGHKSCASRVKELEKELAADQQQNRHIDKHIAGMVEIETKLLSERIATLEATVEHMDEICHTRESRIKELQGELAKETFICTHCGYHNKKGQ